MAILTNMELVVLEHLASGEKNEEIGRSLFISLNTVKTHIASIYKEVGVPTGVNKRAWVTANYEELKGRNKMLELGTRVRIKASRIHPVWEKEKEEWLSYEGVVIGYGVPEEEGKEIVQVAWSEGCGFTLHMHVEALEVIGDGTLEARIENLKSVSFERYDIETDPPVGKWRCAKLEELKDKVGE